MKKIYAFEVRKDEEKFLLELGKKNGVEVECSSRLLTLEKIPELEEGSAVTVLGMNRYGEEEMRALSKRDIRYLSTRTIGYNHIDLEAAKRYGVFINRTYALDSLAEAHQNRLAQ